MNSKNLLDTYTIVDVETPNLKNNSICSIAVIHVRNKSVIFSREFLVNPMAEFNERNIEIHHITPKMVETAPTFNLVWDKIAGYFTTGVLLAHNARFDLSVIAKTLTDYDIPVPDMSYICTMEKARRHFPRERFGGYGLSSLCEGIEIDLANHHNAMCDTAACKALFEWLDREYPVDDSDIKTYRYQSNQPAHSAKLSTLQKSMNLLYGILWGIGCDKVITQKEHAALHDWMQENKAYQRDVNFHESFQMLSDVLEDDHLSAKEHERLLRLVGMHITSARYSNTTQAMQILMGIIKGIVSDTQINAKEASALHLWMQAHDNLKGNYPFDKIFDALTHTLADGILDQQEEKILLAIFEQFLNPRQTGDGGRSLSGEPSSSGNNLSDEPYDCGNSQHAKPSAVGINLSGKTCCLTGDFSHGTKTEVEKHISTRGGICIPAITREVDYLIVGGQGSEAWIYGNYGTKVKKALQMQENGHRVQIVEEGKIYEPTL